MNIAPSIQAAVIFSILLLYFNADAPAQTNQTDPCLSQRQRLNSLQNELRALENLPPVPTAGNSPKVLPKETTPGASNKPPTPPNAAAIAAWHEQNDKEVAALITELNSAACQCKSCPPAVDHPYDIIVQQVDDNGIPLNPEWKSQVIAGNLPDCMKGIEDPYLLPMTSQSPFIDVNDAKCPYPFRPGPLGGHADWTAATYTGTVFWGDHSSDDDDYNIQLVTAGLAGCTTSNPTNINCEFDSDETIDHFHTHWWNVFHSAVDNSSSSAKNLINMKQAIVIGALGLDCAHDCASEMHPVWVLAIHVKEDPSDDVWAIFVRNWGNQGYCSSHNIELPLTSITLRLPMPNASAVTVNWDPNCKVNSDGNGTCFLSRGQGNGPFVTLVPNEGALVNFSLPEASAGERINGELHLTWKTSAPPNKSSAFVATPPFTEFEDNRLAETLEKLTKEQQSDYYRNLPKKVITDDSKVVDHSINKNEVPAKKTLPNVKLMPIVYQQQDPSINDQKDFKINLIKKYQFVTPSEKN